MGGDRYGEKEKLRIAFVHLDLGIGGAERLVVDAACGLQNQGHSVEMFTSHHDRSHAFEETLDGTLNVVEVGDFMPKSFLGGFTVLCAILRMCLVGIYLLHRHYNEPFDVIFCDQVPFCIPILKLSGCRILFYCHFPDLLLSSRESFLKHLYRSVFDFLEQETTAMADKILVNSEFTRNVFLDTFKRIAAKSPDLEVLYPSIDMSVPVLIDFDSADKFPAIDNRVLFVSINRFERKKNIGLAILAFARVRDQVDKSRFDRYRLIVAGGYDRLVPENVQYDAELRKLCKRENFKVSNFPDLNGDVVFLHSFSREQKAFLLENSRCVLYTPEKEHFGIVPIESMLFSTPVVATNSGGPLESIVHEETGFLCNSSADEFARFMILLAENDSLANEMGKKGRKRVEELFSLDAFSEKLDLILAKLITSPRKSSWNWLLILFIIVLPVFWFYRK